MPSSYLALAGKPVMIIFNVTNLVILALKVSASGSHHGGGETAVVKKLASIHWQFTSGHPHCGSIPGSTVFPVLHTRDLLSELLWQKHVLARTTR